MCNHCIIIYKLFISSFIFLGIFKNCGPYNIYIDTTAVKEFYQIVTKDNLVLGANISLNKAIEVLSSQSTKSGFKHLDALVKHWALVANVGVRNVSLN